MCGLLIPVLLITVDGLELPLNFREFALLNPFGFGDEGHDLLMDILKNILHLSTLLH